MSQGIDDFTIVLPHLRDMGACENDESVRLIRGHRDQASDWELHDEATGVDQTAAGEVEFPLTIRVEDAKGNILKMRLQLEP